ncbi:hypothetical protein [endosymbiont GvMRE of Glomus versiforme]|nr:hypothetical protein [endosymbiont GvMRE of Glomus versiforme]
MVKESKGEEQKEEIKDWKNIRPRLYFSELQKEWENKKFNYEKANK